MDTIELFDDHFLRFRLAKHRRSTFKSVKTLNWRLIKLIIAVILNDWETGFCANKEVFVLHNTLAPRLLNKYVYNKFNRYIMCIEETHFQWVYANNMCLLLHIYSRQLWVGPITNLIAISILLYVYYIKTHFFFPCRFLHRSPTNNLSSLWINSLSLCIVVCVRGGMLFNDWCLSTI